MFQAWFMDPGPTYEKNKDGTYLHGAFLDSHQAREEVRTIK